MNIFFLSRKYWEGRAAQLPADGWRVGRTDIRSYVDGKYVHYAYPPDKGERVAFRGSPTSALRSAVRYAEKMNWLDAMGSAAPPDAPIATASPAKEHFVKVLPSGEIVIAGTDDSRVVGRLAVIPGKGVFLDASDLRPPTSDL